MKSVRIPNADHPISVDRSAARVRVTADGHVVADTTRALALRESDYPAVQYVPRDDANMSLLERSDHRTYCPYKGEASYYDIKDAPRGKNAVWTYETPHEAVAEIKDYLAFYPDRVDSIEEIDNR